MNNIFNGVFHLYGIIEMFINIMLNFRVPALDGTICVQHTHLLYPLIQPTSGANSYFKGALDVFKASKNEALSVKKYSQYLHINLYFVIIKTFFFSVHFY